MSHESLAFAGLDQAAMEAVARRLVGLLRPGMLIALRGDLGAGKTTVVRAMLRAAGITGSVKSPTYTLVEPYSADGLRVFHFDCYRLKDPEELEALGIRDYLDGHAACLVEWPERAEGVLPAPDIEVVIEIRDQKRDLAVSARSERGRQSLAEVQ